jgi:dUTP pyrophosphatase
MLLEYFKDNPYIPDPNFQTKMAACFDLAAYIPRNEKVKVYSGKECMDVSPIYDSEKEDSYVCLMPGERALIRTGLTFKLPDGYSLRLHPRSGMALKYGLTLTNCEGVVDEDYTYETKLIMMNTNSKDSIKIYNKDRVAQAELVVYEQPLLAEIQIRPGLKTDRVGGFGSTGER